MRLIPNVINKYIFDIFFKESTDIWRGFRYWLNQVSICLKYFSAIIKTKNKKEIFMFASVFLISQFVLFSLWGWALNTIILTEPPNGVNGVIVFAMLYSFLLLVFFLGIIGRINVVFAYSSFNFLEKNIYKIYQDAEICNLFGVIKSSQGNDQISLKAVKGNPGNYGQIYDVVCFFEDENYIVSYEIFHKILNRKSQVYLYNKQRKECEEINLDNYQLLDFLIEGILRQHFYKMNLDDKKIPHSDYIEFDMIKKDLKESKNNFKLMGEK